MPQTRRPNGKTPVERTLHRPQDRPLCKGTMRVVLQYAGCSLLATAPQPAKNPTAQACS
ncbi:hypothetical protein BDR07DRAFT_1445823, partial [Suillus spraguei]